MKLDLASHGSTCMYTCKIKIIFEPVDSVSESSHTRGVRGRQLTVVAGHTGIRFLHADPATLKPERRAPRPPSRSRRRLRHTDRCHRCCCHSQERRLQQRAGAPSAAAAASPSVAFFASSSAGASRRGVQGSYPPPHPPLLPLSRPQLPLWTNRRQLILMLPPPLLLLPLRKRARQEGGGQRGGARPCPRGG